MDQNLNNERIVGFLGQSYVLIPRKVLEMLFRGEGRERSVGMVYLALFSEVFFKDGKVFLNKRYYVCKRGEFVGQCEELAKRCGMCTKTLNRSLVWLQEKDLIGLKRLNGGIRVCVCGYDSIMGIRRKEAGKDAPEQSAFLALEEAERRMGGRSMQFDFCSANVFPAFASITTIIKINLSVLEKHFREQGEVYHADRSVPALAVEQHLQHFARNKDI